MLQNRINQASATADRPVQVMDITGIRLELLDTMMPPAPFLPQNDNINNTQQLQDDVDELAALLEDEIIVKKMSGYDIECEMQLDPQVIKTIRNLYETLLAIPGEVQEQIFSFRIEIGDYLLGHLTDVGRLSALLAQKLNADAGREVVNPVRAAIAGFLHDLGKMQPTQKVISEIEGRLSDEQYEAMKDHPTYGAMALYALSNYEEGKYLPISMGEFREIYEAILTHHTRHDQGARSYPQYVKQPSLLGELVAIADSFHAMTSNRSYSKLKGDMEAQVTHAYNELQKYAGSQFHPKMARAFCELHPVPVYHEPEPIAEQQAEMALAA